RNRIPSLTREALDLSVGRPGIELALEPFRPLRLRLLDDLAHAPLSVLAPKRRKPGAAALAAILPAFVLGFDLCPWGVLARVRERYRHPRFTATTFGPDATGCAVDSQDGVLDHDLVSLLDHHVRPAHLTTLLCDTLNVTINQSLKRHGPIIPISIGFVK